MINKLIKELEDRKSFVERADFDIQTSNREHFRSFWLHIIILSSSIVIGMLPIMNQESTLIKSLTLAKFGLLLIIFVCVLVIVYYQDALTREKSLIFDQSQFHHQVFSDQFNLIKNSEAEGKYGKEIEKNFTDSKSRAFIEEQRIVAKHILYKRFPKFRIFIDKYFNQIISYIFILAIFLIILSFIKLR